MESMNLGFILNFMRVRKCLKMDAEFCIDEQFSGRRVTVFILFNGA